MVAEIGLLALIVALLFASLLVIVPGFGLLYKQAACQSAAPFYVYCQFGSILLSYACLTYCFFTDDFTLTYVLNNSSVLLPLFYKLCAVWGGHEGSMLLWVAILSFWMLMVTLFSQQMDEAFRLRVLMVLGALSIGFILFLISTSNPFARQFVDLSTQGRDLNPLLQDPGFLFHPPMLYMGYVGFSVAFSFAIAALWLGRMESAWAKWVRPWTLASWCCLTAGITLGSWWAYRELGWGGWWFWDPVENASFMPWLIGTALIHSLAVSEKRQQFIAWTLLLAIAAFSLSLVGTFLVRSGVLTSVHAFAVDPARGMYILCFLAVVIGGSLLLFACRAQTLKKHDSPALLSRESSLLLNNVFLVVMMLTVLMGTVYPLLIDGLGLGKLSVGAPYFNTVMVPLMGPLLLLMGIGIHLHWRLDKKARIYRLLMPILLMSGIGSVVFLVAWGQVIYGSALLGIFLAFWVILSTSKWVYHRLKQWGVKQFGQSFLGMIIAHYGVAVAVIGVALSSAYGIQEDVKLKPGEYTSFANFTVFFQQEKALKGPNFEGTQAHFVIREGKKEVRIYPEKRFYTVANMPMTEAAIDVNPFRDIYIALGEPLADGAWSVRIYLKPFVRWIWGGGFMILLGGLIAFFDRRYWALLTRRAVSSSQTPALMVK